MKKTETYAPLLVACPLMAPILPYMSTAYIDESGGPDTRTCLMGGYVGDQTLWDSFSHQWQVVCAEVGIQRFHMIKCEGGKEDGFEKLSQEERHLLCQRLVGVIRRHKPRAFIVSMRSADYKQIVLGGIPEKLRRSLLSRQAGLSHQYILLAADCIFAILQLQDERFLQAGQIDIVFDWHEECGQLLARTIESMMRAYLALESKEVAARLGQVTWPRPGERYNHVPLEAADFLVWHWRRALDEPDGQDRLIYRQLMAASTPRAFQESPEVLSRKLLGVAIGIHHHEEILRSMPPGFLQRP